MRLLRTGPHGVPQAAAARAVKTPTRLFAVPAFQAVVHCAARPLAPRRESAPGCCRRLRARRQRIGIRGRGRRSLVTGMGDRGLRSPCRRGVACGDARRAPRSLTPCAQRLLPSRGRRLPLRTRRRGVRPDRPQVPVGIGRVEEFVAVRRGRGEMRLAVAQRPVVERRKQAQRHPRQPRPRIEIPHRAQHLLRRHRERRPGPFRLVGRGVRTRLPFVGARRNRLVLGRSFVEVHRSFVHFAQRFVAPAQRCLVGVRQGGEVPRRSVDRAQRFVHFAQRFVVGVRQGFEGHRRSVDCAQRFVVGVREGFEGHRRSVDRAQILVGVGSHFVHFALHFVHFAQSLVGGVRHGVEGHRRSVDRAQSLFGAGPRFVHFAQSPFVGWLHFVAPAPRFVALRRRSI